tara:strand:- start:1621 stop:2520 length:900 start_codon:yes stop_codon:yes gene_type:complete
MAFNHMMNIKIVLLVTAFLGLFCNITYAQNDVHSLLISGNTKQLRQAAKMMAIGKQNTSENLLLLANIIKQEYETAPTNRIDALSWGCRALGATSDSQYLPLLQSIYQSKVAHKKLKKYASKAYQSLLKTTQAVMVNDNTVPIERKTSESNNNLYLSARGNIDNLIPKASLTANQRQIFAIAKGEWQAIKYIVLQLRAAKKQGTTEITVYDALGQFLVEMYAYNLDNQKIDVLAWICRTLGESKNGRYKTLLQNIANQVSNKKLRNYASSASRSLSLNTTPYIIDSVNFQKILDEYQQK